MLFAQGGSAHTYERPVCVQTAATCFTVCRPLQPVARHADTPYWPWCAPPAEHVFALKVVRPGTAAPARRCAGSGGQPSASRPRPAGRAAASCPWGSWLRLAALTAAQLRSSLALLHDLHDALLDRTLHEQLSCCRGFLLTAHLLLGGCCKMLYNLPRVLTPSK